jgi:hypothetical protein
MRRLLLIAFLLSLGSFSVRAADEKPKDTEKAAATRKALDSKVTVDWKEEKLQDALDELGKKIKDASGTEVKVGIDSKVSGATRNAKVTFASKDKPVKELLEAFCKANGYGYIVVSGTYTAGKKPPAYPAKEWDGALLITKGDERGYPDADKK